MRMLVCTIAAACLACTGPLRAADGDKNTPLPAPAKAALDKLAASEDRLGAEYKKNLIAERQKTIGELQKVLKDVTRSGDLDTALAVKARIDELNAKNEADDDTDLLGNKKATDPKKLLPGTWAFTKSNGTAGTMVLDEDGRITAHLTAPLDFPGVPGHWEMKDGHVLITWIGDASKWEKLDLTGADKLAGESSDVGKNGFHATKQPQKK